METIILGLFVAALVVCVVLDISILVALVLGFLLFSGYSLYRGFSVKATGKMAWKGLRTSRNILIVFMLIGIITAAWRASGTIPMIIYTATQFILPSIYLLVAFLLNCLVSILMGTSFGTAATAGSITMAIGLVLGMEPAHLGGAILSGVYVGDRCSPMSTSALLVSTLTDTNIFDNIGAMIRTTVVPFVLTCLFYLWLGGSGEGAATSIQILELFEENFNLHWLALIPATIIILLSLFRINVKITMVVSILISVVLAVTIQGMEFGHLLQMLVTGYLCPDDRLASMLNGGGITSMIKVMLIVGLSSCYSGIFEETGLLRQMQAGIHRLSKKITPFGGMIVTSVVAGAVACNQTLTIMLTNELCHDTVEDNREMAIHLENTAVPIAPLIPWSIAGAVPLASAGAPTISLVFACYLYILPLWQLVTQARHKRKHTLATILATDTLGNEVK